MAKFARDIWRVLAVAALASFHAGCGQRPTSDISGSESQAAASGDYSSISSIQQIIPQDRLQKIRAALPKVAYPPLQEALESPETLWYDHEVMTPSYQDSVGAQANSKWPNLVAGSQAVKTGLHDFGRKRWQFPFGTTAGTDDSTNLKVANFIRLPHVNGRPLSIPIWEVRRNFNRPQWMWVYPKDTLIGEVLFVESGDQLLTSEIRIRTRHSAGWSTNVYRPFPRATDLAAEIKRRRPDWQSRANLNRLVQHLENNGTLASKTMAARAALKPTFEATGALDVLPDFEDPALVKELLTTTTFISSYGAAWKTNGSQKTFAAATSSDLSIVPKNYEAGMFEVKEDSCMRCHKEAGRLVSEFYGDLLLYGELWGKDGIFSFHPFDESQYSKLRSGPDNRRMNPRLKEMGVFESYDATKHESPLYPPRSSVLGAGG